MQRLVQRCAIVTAVLAGTLRLSAAPLIIEIDPAHGSTENTGSIARLMLEFGEQGGDDLVMLTLANTTPPAIGSRLTAVGLELPDVPSFTPVFAPGGAGAYFDTLTYDVDVSPGWLNAAGGYDMVLSSDGDFLGGQPLGAPMAGESELVTLSLGDTGLSSIQLADAFADFYANLAAPHAIGRFQSVGPDQEDSDKVAGVIPEPATLVLLAAGAGWLARRRRSAGSRAE